MARKNENSQKAAMREMMHSYLKENDIRIKNGTDVNVVICDMMSVILEDVLDEQLGYSKYDYRNKETSNSRNGHSKKPCIPAMATWMLQSRATGTASMNPRS